MKAEKSDEEVEENEDKNDETVDTPDLTKFIDRNTLRLLYEILNVKLTHGINFQSFYDLMQLVSENLESTDREVESVDDYLHISVMDLFCKNFIRGFSKLIIDLGFDNFLLDEIE